MQDPRKALVLESFRMFDDPALVDRYVDPAWLNHEASPANREGLAGAHGTVRTLRAAFADLHLTPHQVLADGDLVAVHLTMSGRHVGRFAGLEPTGRRFATRHVHVWRIAGDRLVEHWAVRDDVGMHAQLETR